MSLLSYLLVIQKSGLPVYAQSFEFEDDNACQSFNQIMKPGTNKAQAHLMGGYFSSMQLFADELVADKLNLVELGFNKFEIKGLIKNEVFFIGIFQHFKEGNQSSEFLEVIANQFLLRYSLDDIHDDFVSHIKFSDFTDILLKLSQGEISTKNCRNCLTKCTTEDKGCIPHSFYFNKVSFQDDMIILSEQPHDT